jgi:glucoamylase
LAAGRRAEAEALTAALSGFANEGGLLPEQVWDVADLPERELVLGQATGSAMPLVWAHAEYIKLCRSLAEGRVFDTPPQTVQRYQVERRESPYAIWRFNHKCQAVAAGKYLRIELNEPAVIHWSADGWVSADDVATRDSGLGIHLAELPTKDASIGQRFDFTFHWSRAGRWEGNNYFITVVSPGLQSGGAGR